MTLSYALQYPNEVAGIVTLGAVMYKEGYPAEHGDLLSKIITTPLLGKLILNTLLKTPLGKECQIQWREQHSHLNVHLTNIKKKCSL